MNFSVPNEFVESPSGLILPEKVAEERYFPKRTTGIDLFSGCGGMTLGFIEAGFEVVAAVENDPFAAFSYLYNFCRYGEFQIHFVGANDQNRLEKVITRTTRKRKKKGLIESYPTAGSGWISFKPISTPGVSHFIFGDITKISGDQVLKMIGMDRGEVGCVFGGPPCQGFSKGGKQNPDDKRNELVFEFIRMVNEIQPKTVVMENVPAILNMNTHDGLSVIDTVTRMLEDGAYSTVDKLRKVLRDRHGALGVVRSNGNGKPNGKKKVLKKSPAPDPAQQVLFDQV